MRSIRRMCALIVTASFVATSLMNASTYAVSLETVTPVPAPSTHLKLSAYDIELQSEKQTQPEPQVTTTTYQEVVRYVELYNDSSEPIDMREYVLKVTDTLGTILATASFNEHASAQKPYLVPGGYVTVSFNSYVSGTQFDFTSIKTDYGTIKPGLDREFQLFRGGASVYAKSVKLKVDSLQPQTRLIFATVAAEEKTAENSKVYDTPLYEPIFTFGLSPIEILANPKACSPVDFAMACREYIKFYNSTSETIQFDGTRLRIGSLGQSSTVSNTAVLTGTVKPGGYTVFSLPITNSGGYVWLEDKYGVMPYENTIVEYPDASNTAHKGQAWSLVDEDWVWALPNPGGENTPLPVVMESPSASPSSLASCKSDQYRNPETNRCKLISLPSSSVKPCAANEYRSPQTNRCRSLSHSSSSSLTPCATNQYRNPETNRCRSIVSAASALKPCAANQERNSETNRCRNMLASTMPTADFPVEKDQVIAGDQSLGWVAFAGVGLMAAGYGGWEWRYELAGIFRTLKRLVIKS